MTNAPVIPEIIKNYLDGLNDEQRDNVITAESFKIGGGYRPGQKGGPREITKVKQAVINEGFRIGNVIRHETKIVILPDEPATGCLIDHATQGTSREGYGTVGATFDRFFKSNGNAAIYAIKQYAAKLNKVELHPNVVKEEWTRPADATESPQDATV